MSEFEQYHPEEGKLKVLILKGLPASGKSTFAKSLLSRFPDKYLRWNNDSFFEMAAIDNESRGNLAKKKIHRQLLKDFIHQGLKHKYNLIIDNTNLSERVVKEITETIDSVNIKDIAIHIYIVDHFLSVPLDIILERDRRREKPVEKSVILGMYNTFLKKPFVMKFDSSLINAVIFDVDNTLAQINGRGAFEWDKVGTDIPNEPIVMVYNQLKVFHRIIMSGRDSICRKLTEDWLYKNGIRDYEMLLMRNKNDMRSDTVIKKELYEKYIKGKYNIVTVFDDRDKVVDMWRSLGLSCCQVNYGSF